MIATRWIKAWRDAVAARGRLAAIVVALAASVAAVTTMGVATVVLTREVARNYLATNPASAQLELGGAIDPGLLDQVRGRPNIAQADSAATLRGSIETRPGEWMPLMVFVVPDLAALSINTLHPEAGAWPPATGTLLVERSALPLTHHAIGEAIVVNLPHAGHRSVVVAGTVHDAGVAPAAQEQVVYAYATARTMAALGEPVALDLLKIVVAAGGDDSEAISHTARELASWLTARGATIIEARVPPPRRHPHQAQMNAVLAMLTIFSALVLVLGAVLSATIIGGLLAQQVRQIAVMKAIGARSAQIAGPVLATAAGLGLVATALGLPLGLAAANAFIGAVAGLLNLRIASGAPPGWTIAAVVAAGLVAPVVSAIVPVIGATRRTVRASIDDHGGRGSERGDGRLMRALASLGIGHGAFKLALRNTFRRRTRLALTLTLLAGAGAMFLAGVDLRGAWQDTVAQAGRERHFDLELVLDKPAPFASSNALLRALPAVRDVEPWDGVGATIAGPDALAIVHRYPDGGHGGFALRSAPASTTLIAHDLVEGRWLRTGDTDALVVNVAARAQDFAAVRLGDVVTLEVDHRRVPLHLVGVTRETLAPGAAYVTPATFDAAASGAAATGVLRVALTRPDDVEAAARTIATTLRQAGIGLRGTIAQKRVAAAQGAHVAILVLALGFIAALMGVVGLLGLASALATSTAERTREFGVMRALGASQATTLRIVVTEGVVIGLIGSAMAVGLSLPLSAFVGQVLASISNQHLAPHPSLAGSAALFLAATAGALAASLVPAWRASRWTVQQALVLA